MPQKRNDRSNEWYVPTSVQATIDELVQSMDRAGTLLGNPRIDDPAFLVQLNRERSHLSALTEHLATQPATSPREARQAVDTARGVVAILDTQIAALGANA